MLSFVLSAQFLVGAVAGAVTTVLSKAVYAFVSKQTASVEARLTALEAQAKTAAATAAADVAKKV